MAEFSYDDIDVLMCEELTPPALEVVVRRWLRANAAELDREVYETIERLMSEWYGTGFDLVAAAKLLRG